VSPPATTLVATPTIANVLADIIAVIQAVLGTGVPVYRGVVNRVAAPLPQSGFVILTPIYQQRLQWNIDTASASPALTQQMQAAYQLDVQADIYGSGGWTGTWASMLIAVWNDEFACNLMQNSQPLYVLDSRMIPLTDSEQQYEERWSLTLAAQYNPVVTPAQLYADAITGTLVSVTEEYPS
jgi:hypothetical protein